MQFDTNTLNVLKNFSTINPSILIKEGGILKTMAPTKTVFAKAKMSQEFEKQIAIYDLSNFLSAMSMFDNPVLEFNDDNSANITAKNDTRGIKYMFANPQTIVTPPDSDIKLDEPYITFKLKNKSISDAIKALGILNLPDIAIVGDGNELTIQAIDAKKQVSSYSDTIGVTDKKFTAYLKAENIKMLPSDYEVVIATVKNTYVVYFSNSDVEYWIPVEANSKF
jgi:hypothetical protein